MSTSIWKWILSKVDITTLLEEVLASRVEPYLDEQKQDFKAYQAVRKGAEVLAQYPKRALWVEMWLAAKFVCTHGTPTQDTVLAFLAANYKDDDEAADAE